jgi:hypothetical protein
VQRLQSELGVYILSDKPLTEDEWIEQRTKLEPKTIEATSDWEQTAPDSLCNRETIREASPVNTEGEDKD